MKRVWLAKDGSRGDGGWSRETKDAKPFVGGELYGTRKRCLAVVGLKKIGGQNVASASGQASNGTRLREYIHDPQHA